MTKKTFPRRIYPDAAAFLHDLKYLMSNRSLIRSAMRSTISAEFRERLMLTVTEVNGCKYCRYAHARMALKAGLLPQELDQFLAGNFPSETPAQEIPALLYAQHWAETDARPEPETIEKITTLYGQEISNAIHIILRMIRMGNLMGNTLDYVLFNLSFGKLGV
jgi:AhpD family alkylhydroperoxidase